MTSLRGTFSITSEFPVDARACVGTLTDVRTFSIDGHALAHLVVDHGVSEQDRCVIRRPDRVSVEEA